MRNFLAIVVLLLAMGAAGVQAREPEPAPLPPEPGEPAALTLSELRRIALASNPTLAQARMRIRAAEGRQIQAGLYPNPRIGYLGDEIGSDGKAGLQGAGIRQELVTAGKLRLGQSAAGHAVQQARHAWETQRWRVLNDVRTGYYEVLLAQKLLDVNRRLVRVGDEGVEATKRQLAALEVSRAQLLQVKIEAETAALKLREAHNHHHAAWRRLAAVIGQPGLEPATLAGSPTDDMPELTFEDTLAGLMDRSPELAAARAGVERARCESARQSALRVPNVEVGAAVRHNANTRDTVVNLELSLPLQLFDRNQGNIVKAQAELVAATNEVRRVELRLHNRLATAFEQYANARRQVETYGAKILPNAKESLGLIQEGYRLGEFGYLELLTAQRTFFNANLDYLRSLQQLWNQGVRVEGMLLGDSLEPAGG